MTSAVAFVPDMSLEAHERLQPSPDTFNSPSSSRNVSKFEGAPIVVPSQPLPGTLDTPKWEFVAPAMDRNLLQDDRVMHNFVIREDNQLRCGPLKDYFGTVQKEIQPHMRDLVTEWMLDVCSEENVDSEVFPLAVHLMDRFLCIDNIYSNQLQALASACLLTAAKVKMPLPLSLSKLSEYTDRSVSVGELISWELLVLGRLEWDVSLPTAFDFFDRLVLKADLGASVSNLIRDDCRAIAHRIAREFRMAQLPASVQACLCVTAALMKRCPQMVDVMNSQIERSIGIDPTLLCILLQECPSCFTVE